LVVGCGLWIVGCGLLVVGCELCCGLASAVSYDTHFCVLVLLGYKKKWTKMTQDCTVRLTSIHYRVSGNQKFCFAPTETIDGRVKKIRSPTCGMV
jgi:hypothetical protein